MTAQNAVEMQLVGYNENNSNSNIPKDREDFIKMYGYFQKLIKNDYEDETPIYQDKESVISSSKEFFNRHFKLNDVLAIEPGYMNDFIKLLNHKDIHLVDRYLSYFSYFASPFSLSCNVTGKSCVLYIITDYSFKAVYPSLNFKERIALALDRNKNILKYPLSRNYNLMFKEYNLDNISLTSPYEYTHEVTHTQVDLHKGANTDYANKELISIFLEKLHAYEDSPEVFDSVEKKRLTALKYCIGHYVFFPNTDTFSFIDSTLKSEILFDRYVNASLIKRKEILDDIQDIFDGFYTLEDLLIKYNIDSKNEEKYDAISHNLSM